MPSMAELLREHYRLERLFRKKLKELDEEEFEAFSSNFDGLLKFYNIGESLQTNEQRMRFIDYLYMYAAINNKYSFDERYDNSVFNHACLYAFTESVPEGISIRLLQLQVGEETIVYRLAYVKGVYNLTREARNEGVRVGFWKVPPTNYEVMRKVAEDVGSLVISDVVGGSHGSDIHS